MNFPDKSRRLRERIKLSLPVRIRCRESKDYEWVELSRLLDVTPFGARFTLAHATERGRLLHLTLPMPRQLRCFDHVEDQYRVWGLVRRVMPHQPAGGETAVAGTTLRLEVGVAFTGKHPPASYQNDPTTLYVTEALSPESNMWSLREDERPGNAGAARSQETRLQMAVNVLVEVFDEAGEISSSEQTVTENISRRGAAVWTTLEIERGRFVRLTNLDHGLSLIAAVRAHRKGPDGIPRLHLEFIDREWPLEGIE
ncbi:MAG: PilZ domain-containing protein [Acidobacteria bacterium]|nr:PilZ domain-containing protein [Acidobacteriota bacterium]